MKENTKVILFYTAVAIISFIPYLSLLNADFVHWDDDVYIVENERVKNGLNFENIKWAFSTIYFGFYYPLTWISHMVDCSFFGLNAKMHHLTNILWHILNSVLLFSFFNLATKEKTKSFILASIFAVHPLNVESVAWISERKNLLAAFFFLLGLNFYLMYVKNKSKTKYVLVYLSYLLGMIAKPILVTFPFALLLLDFWPLERIKYEKNLFSKKQEIIFEKIWFLIPIPLFAYLTLVAQKKADALVTLSYIPMKDRIAGAIIAIKDYLFNFFLPIKLTALYPHLKNTYSISLVIISALLLLVILYLCLKLWEKEPVYLFGFLWFLVNLSPVIGIIQVGEQARADRYMYIPMIGILALLIYGLGSIKTTISFKKIIFAIYILILIVFSVKTHYQCLKWRNTETLFSYMLEVSPNASQAYHNLALINKDRGEIDKAIELYKKAISIEPCKAKSLNNLGSCYAEKGDFENAIKCFQKAIDCNPKLSQGYYNMGLIFEKMGRVDNAIEYYNKTIEIDPKKGNAYYGLGRCFIIKGDFKMAVSRLEKAYELMPDNQNVIYDLGYAMEQMGNNEMAIKLYLEVIKIDPKHILSRKQLVGLLIKESKFKEALNLVEESVSIYPDNIDFAKLKEEILKKYPK